MSIAHNASQLVRCDIFLKPIVVSTFRKAIVSLLQSRVSTCHASQVHAAMIKSGLDRDRFLTSKLLSSVIHDSKYAAPIFHALPNRNVFMYNAMLRSYTISDAPGRAIDFFCDLRYQGLEMDQFTFVFVNKAIAQESAVETGQMVHGIVLRLGFLSFVDVKNSLLHVYSTVGRIIDARNLFDESSEKNDLVSWNILMGTYLKVGHPHVCIYLFKEVLRLGLWVTDFTVLCILSALSLSRTSLHGGQSVHGFCFKTGLCTNLTLRAVTSLIKYYAVMSCIDDARKIFDSVQNRDIILWNCMVDSYAHFGQLEEALALLEQMKVEKVKPNKATLVGLLSASAESGLLKFGTLVNNVVVDEGLEIDVALGTALVDMYVKCGDLSKALHVFRNIKSKDVKLWTAMAVGYGLHGQASKAISLLSEMEQEGVPPNDVTFLAVLTACSHCGMVEEAIVCFMKMVQVHSLTPTMDHYVSIIDLLGRAGLLEEGSVLINSLPIKTDIVAWRALLSACRVYGNVNLAKYVRRKLLELGEEHPADSLLISSSCSIAGKLPDEKQSPKSINGSKNIDVESRTTNALGTVRKSTHWIQLFLK